MSTESKNEYIAKGEDIMAKVEGLVKPERLRSDGWEVLDKTDDYSLFKMDDPFSKGNTLYRSTGVLACSPEHFYDMLLFNETTPLWRADCDFFKTTAIEDPVITICNFQVASTGLISARDFCDVRYWKMLRDEPGAILIAYTSVEHPSCKPYSGATRGTNFTGGFLMRPVEGEPNKIEFTWIFSFTLNGWIPNAVVRAATSTFVKDTYAQYKAAAAKLTEGGLQNLTEYAHTEFAEVSEETKKTDTASLPLESKLKLGRWRTIFEARNKTVRYMQMVAAGDSRDAIVASWNEGVSNVENIRRTLC